MFASSTCIHLVLALTVVVPSTAFRSNFGLQKRGNSLSSTIQQPRHPETTCLYMSQRSSMLGPGGMDEWRETIFGGSPTLSSSPTVTSSSVGEDSMEHRGGSKPIAREICVLPFPYEDVLLQGETKELRLYEDRFIQLFEKATTEHGGVIAMGLLADSGIIQTVPLCEMESITQTENLGIFLKIRAVGRASLLEIVQQEPYIVAACVELTDTPPATGSCTSQSHLEFPNLVAGNVENAVVTLSSLNHRLLEKKRREEGLTEDEMAMQELEDDEDDEDEDEEVEDLNEQFRRAFRRAQDADSQGYTTITSSSTNGVTGSGGTTGSGGERSLKQLTALSWAAFSIAGVDSTRRLQALDCVDLFDRLKFAAYTLREMRSELEAKVALDGIGGSGSGSGEEEEGEGGTKQ